MPTRDLQALPRLIGDELDLSDRLLNLLQQEQRLLSTMELDPLPDLVRDKEQALEALQHATQKRLHSLHRAGFNSLEQLSGRIRMPQQLERRIQRLRDNIRRARELNSQNGLLIHRGMQVNQHLLHILSGSRGPDESADPVYLPARDTRARQGSLLGEA